MIENRITRLMCHGWLRDRGYSAPRSACIGCPYHSNSEWLDMKQNRPEDWKEAVEFDELIRDYGGMRGQLFLHSQRVPLADAKLWTKQDESQLPLFAMDDECSGMCGT